MRFRLVYDGELKARQRDVEGQQRDKLAGHKQEIRKQFHVQLARLWQSNTFLREKTIYPNDNMGIGRPPADVGAVWAGDPNERIPFAEYVAHRYQRLGYRFVPLVLGGLSLSCSLEILFMRRDVPGSAISAGDLDNRVKTLIDGLRMPTSAAELQGNEQPAVGETPFYCLLEDDNLVSRLSVETDMLLSPPTGNVEIDRRTVRAVITVDLKPYDVTMFNLSFA